MQLTETGIRESAYIVHADVYGAGGDVSRPLDSVIEEIEGLARAIDLDVCKTEVLKVSRIQPGAFFGKGQRQRISDSIEAYEPDIIIVNYALSPVQQRNLEREWQVKVIDRTGLILEIFGARAQTKEGRLQVELAALEYQRSRLVRSWTHLERQRGGAGFMGGPGETQIEIDRRLIDQRISKLKKQLETVRRTRELGRKARARVPYSVVALVGYTNAGKSTLFNALTKAGVFAEDLPFATLDPTMRRIRLPNGQEVILSDTVGFIADLPTHLVESFRATLEQITQADVIVHVIDSSREDYESQKSDVIEILKDLGIEYETDRRILEAYNKIDRLSPDDLHEFERRALHDERLVVLSAVQGKGITQLLQKASEIISSGYDCREYDLDAANGKALSWLYDHGDVLEAVLDKTQNTMHVRVKLSQQDQKRFQTYFSAV